MSTMQKTGWTLNIKIEWKIMMIFLLNEAKLFIFIKHLSYVCDLFCKNVEWRSVRKSFLHSTHPKYFLHIPPPACWKYIPLIPELLLPQFNWSPNKFQKWKKYPNILLWKNHVLQKWGQRGKFLQLRETHSAMHRYCCRTWWQSFTNAFLGNLTRVRGTPLWNAVVTEVEIRRSYSASQIIMRPIFCFIGPKSNLIMVCPCH